VGGEENFHPRYIQSLKLDEATLRSQKHQQNALTSSPEKKKRFQMPPSKSSRMTFNF